MAERIVDHEKISVIFQVIFKSVSKTGLQADIIIQDEATGEVQIELNDIKPGIYIAEFCNKEFKKTDKLIIQ